MITIKKEELENIYKHAKDDYPYECCGILVGQGRDDKVVKRAYRTENINKDRAHDRYEIASLEFLRIDEQARADNLEIIGFYHSHPNHPARPSAFDAERAWPIYSYFIVSISSSSSVLAKSWGWDEEEKKFKEEHLMVVRSDELQRNAKVHSAIDMVK